MIDKIRIQGFQKHKDPVDFDLGRMTTFVGASDSGKSAVLRALIWVMTNQPRGNGFINNEVNVCKVGIRAEGEVVVREKGGKNSYLVSNVEYKSFGMGIPNELDSLLHTSPASIQRQMDPPFWLTLSPKQLATEFNKICNFELLDDVQKKCKSGLRVVEKELASNKTLQEDTTDQMAELAYRPEVEQYSAEVQSVSKQLEEMDDLMSSMMADWLALSRAEDMLEEPPEWYQDAERLLSVYLTTEEWLDSQRANLEAMQDSLLKLSMEDSKTLRLRTEAIDLQDELDDYEPPTQEVCPTCGKPL